MNNDPMCLGVFKLKVWPEIAVFYLYIFITLYFFLFSFV
jgi:hypothetical protein